MRNSFYSRKLSLERLEYYYQVINTTVLSKQNAASGLIPASVAITTHGDYTDAWVRDNVYSIYCVFGLALAYRRIDDTTGRAFELEHAVIKLMRGLLFSMMRQASKVEKFKKTQNIWDALHAKYKTETGDTVVGDRDWGHLQIDATSIFLVALADMTTSGLTIIYTQDEVDFIQNLVFYIERAYRTPDFGIWERGNKSNHGQPELNTSSIGMAYAALRAINGVNLFGARGSPSSVIYVLPDEMSRNKITLHSVLPRESNSKEVDGSVLSVIGFPAFAVEDPSLIELTRNDARTKLEGRYGWKRFLRDGHQTVVEDHSRLHYNESELKIFENIESEWPLFFTYLVLEGLFTGNMDQVEEYRKKLEFVTIDSSLWDPQNPRPPEDYKKDNVKRPSVLCRTASLDLSIAPPDLHIPLIPELYFVPRESIEAERVHPHSQKRIPNDNTPLVWALSLYLLGNLIYENLLSPSEIDPLGRRFNVKGEKADNVVQVVLLAENEELQKTLARYGLEIQSIDQISSSFTVLPPQALVEVYSALGQNTKLSLSGRPNRPMGTLATSRLYRIEGHIYAFTPQFMDVESFYLNSDPDYLVSTIENELNFTNANWVYPGRPTMTIVLTNAMLGDINRKEVAPADCSASLTNALLSSDASKKNLLNFFMNLRSGECNGVRVRLSRLTETVNTSNIESLDFLINKPDVNWSLILSSNKSYHRYHEGYRRLGFDENSTLNSPAGSLTPGGPRTPPRRRSVFGGKLLGTPLNKMDGDSYFQDIASALEKINGEGISAANFKLKDHEVAPTFHDSPRAIGSPVLSHLKVANGEETASETPISTGSKLKKSANLTVDANSEDANGGSDVLLSLTLGDISQYDDAVKSLEASVNLYDQIDLLQYLASCKNLDDYVPELDTTIRNLLEEVYVKAKRLQYWSIVRQASGLLSKVMPTLTSNLTDLVIRKKQVSIGAGATEHLISTPLSPDALSKMIAEQCLDDVREGPVVQEILLSLGNFIRTNPSMFDGILRLRTHFIIIALREEISRLNGYNEEEAIEHLMQLSPFELQSLLGTVMSGPSMCEDTAIVVRDKPGGFLLFSQEFDPNRQLSTDTYLHKSSSKQDEDENYINPKNENTIVIRAQSGGFSAGNFARVEINDSVLAANTRGLHIWVIDRIGRLVLEHASFDTHISSDESEDLVRFIHNLASGIIVVLASKDDFVEHLTKEAIMALKSLGAREIDNVKYRDSYVLIAEKDGNRTIEAHKPANEGPTDLVEEEFALLKKDDIAPHEINNTNINYFCPTSNGRWLRRRKNDGALNRVPRHFFSRVWKVLDTCFGLEIGSHHLPRDPIVFEKTPEEFNFALAVEAFLGYFRDPAEKQVAIEILIQIYQMQKSKSEFVFIEQNINIPEIMESAVADFWHTWVDKNKETFEKSPMFENGFDYKTHKEIANSLFYDLPLDGQESTTTYLRKSISKALNI
ncbi:glycosyl hydrolases family 15-domain-containing protein [Cokeromyces recurvatus]|uniref:glycosyl hydrolases family 15-domain-containing protein n=1 Tax=Cokeromyces recurvatus TaxID=90255 RepID=UPI0022211C41|nr:glycosyl hydrolases family 15-domain-containing protein [Cokeromyces recurvatus]KAI7898371.1 glycosyl hydrolases family 15-domain-containing protein [Cokeromyces recurvatus]